MLNTDVSEIAFIHGEERQRLWQEAAGVADEILCGRYGKFYTGSSAERDDEYQLTTDIY